MNKKQVDETRKNLNSDFAKNQAKQITLFTYDDLWKYGDKRQMEGSYAAFESVVKWCDKEIACLNRARKKTYRNNTNEYYQFLTQLSYVKKVRNVFNRRAKKVQKLIIN